MINESDFYVIILAGKYGTVSLESKLSFTEMEFEYAYKIKKPIIAILYEHPEKLSLENSEIDQEKREKLMQFRKRLESERIVQYWTSLEDLAFAISQSLVTAIEEYEYTLKGWIRPELDIQKLEGILNHYQGGICVTLPLYRLDEEKYAAQFGEIRGLMELSNLLGKIDVSLEIVSGKEDSIVSNKSEICIGGPLANEVTNAYMKMYVPDFKCVVNSDSDFFERDGIYFYKEIARISENGEQYFEAGKEKLYFSPEGNCEWGFILKIKTGEDRYCLVFFGETGKGTFSVIEYFCHHYNDIYKKYNNQLFFMAIKVTVIGRIMADRNSIVDLSHLIYE